MKKTIRCPKCNRRLFDAYNESKGPIDIQCKCKDKVLVRFYSFSKIVIKSEQEELKK